ncbi:MAG: hypothetical protein KKG47_17125 [Proteobacteria bacterium]|nr:hypothetical protein [Pseudomonadota bacterium]
MRKFAKVAVLMAMLAMIPSLGFAGSSDIQTTQEEAITISSKVPFKFYGFISAETMYGDSQVASFGTSNATIAAYNTNITGVTRVVDETLQTRNDAFLDFTVQNTRFGFVLDEYDFNGKNFSVEARLEMDFFNLANVNIHAMNPRIRRAYSTIGQERWRVLFGMEWELYSPLNTSTLDVGSNMWFQGNQGFRRPQISFTYNHPIGDESKIEAAASVNLAGNSMSQMDAGVTTAMPMLQARVGFFHKLPAGQLKAYISTAYGHHNNAVVGNAKVKNWGLAASLEVPIHKYLTPMGEFQYGYSLGSQLSLASDTTRQRFIAAWGAVKSCWLDWFETNVGYGVEDLNDAQVAAGWVKNNQKIFANLKFMPVKPLVIGLEYNYLRTNYQGSGASKANTMMLNTIFFF